MIIQFHTPKGIVEIDGETVTDVELSKINLDRRRFNEFLAEQPRDLAVEMDRLKDWAKTKGFKEVEHGPE